MAGLSNANIDLPDRMVGRQLNPRLGIEEIGRSQSSVDSQEQSDREEAKRDADIILQNNDESKDSIEISVG